MLQTAKFKHLVQQRASVWSSSSSGEERWGPAGTGKSRPRGDEEGGGGEEQTANCGPLLFSTPIIWSGKLTVPRSFSKVMHIFISSDCSSVRHDAPQVVRRQLLTNSLSSTLLCLNSYTHYHMISATHGNSQNAPKDGNKQTNKQCSWSFFFEGVPIKHNKST